MNNVNEKELRITDPDCSLAADNERLRKERDRLREALSQIVRYQSWDFGIKKDAWKWCNEFIHIAKAALEGK
jgi:hypothetical protein